MRKTPFILLFVFVVQFASFSQSEEINKLLISLRNYDFEMVSKDLSILSENEIKYELNTYILLQKNKGINHDFFIDTEEKKDEKYSDYHLSVIKKLNTGLYLLYYNKNSDSRILKNYIEALAFAKKTKNQILICEVYRRIMEYHNTIFVIKDTSYKNYLKEYRDIAFDDIEHRICNFYDVSIGIKNTDTDITENQFNSLLSLENSIKINYYISSIKVLKGNYYEEKKDFDNAFKNYTSALDLFEKPEYGYEILPRLGINLNLGAYYLNKKEYKKAKNQLKIKQEYKGKLVHRKQIYFDFWLSNLYEKTNQWDSAYYYLKKSRHNQFEFNQIKHLASVNDIQEKYQTEKKEKENLQLKINIEEEQQQKWNLLIGSIAALIFLVVTAFLLQKNTRKKQKLAEQEKALETQKLATVLKEQELVSIDAMIEGQEKERQRIANDLHDDLGGLMATVKLHFNVLKDKQTPELFDKTTNLLDEAYQKIRSIAHTKNSGVIAKQGLLKAIQNMADKISVSNKIKVEVVDHGLENRLENSLELTIFRIIQELITNVIKHADATEATIHLTNHDDTLNIMIEDNGKGFNTSQITTKNEGMGISSIDKRVEHLNGSMTIESEYKKGTTIIIDIPI